MILKHVPEKDQNGNRSHTSWLDKHFEFVFRILLGCAGLVYVLVNPFLRTGLFNDDAVYVLTSTKLWAASRAFPELGIKPDYPMPGLPLLLAPFTALVAPHWDVLEMLSAAATLLSVFFLNKLIREWTSAGERLFILFFYAFNPVVAKFAGIVMTEPYYAFFCITSFYLLAVNLKRPRMGTGFLLGLTLGWGSVTRPEGVLLAVSVCGVLFFKKMDKRAALGAGIAFFGWLIVSLSWFLAHKTSGSEFTHDIRALIEYWSENGLSTFLFSFQIIKVFLFDTWWALRFVPRQAAETIAAILIAFGAIACAGGFRSFWRTSISHRAVLGSIAVFCSSYFLIHTFWHVAVPRYFLPIFPFLLLFIVRGLSHLGKTATPAWVLLALLYTNEIGYLSLMAQRDPDPMNAPPWRALEWIKRNANPSETINTNIAPTVVLYTGLSAKRGLNATNADLYYYLLMKFKVDYLLRRDGEAVAPEVGKTKNPNIRWARKLRWQSLYPERFPVVFEDNKEQVRISKVNLEPAFVDAFEKYIRAVTEFNEGRHATAIQLAKDSISRYPTMGCAYNLTGVLLTFQNKTKEAEAAFLTARNLLPDSTFEYLNLATIYHQRGDRARSLQYIKDGLDVASRNEEREIYLNNVRQLQEKWENGRATLFIDSPEPSAYSDDDI